MSLQFDNLTDYIWQVYNVGLPTEYVHQNEKPLTYLKLVRVLTRLGIDPSDCTAEYLFSQAVQMERNNHNQTFLMFQLADLHEECEILIRDSGIDFNTAAYADNINT